MGKCVHQRKRHLEANRRNNVIFKKKAKFLGISNKEEINGKTVILGRNALKKKMREKLVINGNRVNFPTWLYKNGQLDDWRKYIDNPDSYEGYERMMEDISNKEKERKEKLEARRIKKQAMKDNKEAA